MALTTGTSTGGHRSVCLVISGIISPRARKMGVKSAFYNQASVLRTIKGIFGASGLTRTEVLSTPLVAYFGAKVDTHSYQAIPAQIDLYATNPKSAKRTSFAVDLTSLTGSLSTCLTAISGR